MERKKFPIERHNSMRGWFGAELYEQMSVNENIWLVLPDLGYKLFDYHRRDFPERITMCGAAEQAALGLSIGLAESGKIPVVYSITTFLLYRPFEIIRNYIDHEQIPVKLVGGGRDHDYAHDGFSHWSDDAELLFRTGNMHQTPIFPNIKSYWPETKEQIPEVLNELLNNGKPSFLSLRR